MDESQIIGDAFGSDTWDQTDADEPMADERGLTPGEQSAGDGLQTVTEGQPAGFENPAAEGGQQE
jgi:hypothetical protein